VPAPTRTLTAATAAAAIHDLEFGRSDHPASEACNRNGVGIELEFLTDDPAPGEATARLSLERAEHIRSVLGDLPARSLLTIEPGGQLEISTRPFRTLDEACAAAAHDLFLLDRTCARLGIGLYAIGQDPVRPPDRIVTEPRYRAMEAYFDSIGPSGRTMMTNTASIQLNVGLGGSDGEAARRWHLANAIGPAMAAAFANSPFADGAPSGWQSSRLRTWWQLDPSRSCPVRVGVDTDPTTAWLDYALAARVMLIRTSADDYLPVTEPMTFGDWLADGHPTGHPTLEDFRYHLTTLFPPVRPRGWFEIRYLDALPTPFWHVAAAVITTLVMCRDLDADVRRATHGAEDLWIDASQLGLGHPRLAAAARELFALAIDALATTGADEATTEVVTAYRDRWIAAHRSPADDARDRWRRDGTLLPVRESPVPYGVPLGEEATRR
jgi:glutamate--cysteine ligase